MSNAQAANALSAVSPYASNWNAPAGSQYGSGINSLSQGSSLLAALSERTQVSGVDSTPVTLSDAARALANGTTATGSSDFDQEAAYLGSLADASLAAMGIVTPGQEAGTQITFDSLSYNISSSASAGVAQAGGQMLAAYGASQQAEFIGQGEITTADGSTYDFQIEVDLGQSQQVAQSSNSGASALPSSTQNGGVPESGIALPWSSDSSSSTADSASMGFSLSSGSGSSSGLINWNAILDQSKSLLELLQSMAQTTQAASAAANNTASGAVGSTASGTAASASSSSDASPASSAPAVQTA